MYKQIVTILLLIISMQSFAQSADTLTVDLSDAIKIALSENTSIRISDMEIEKKQTAIKGNKGALLPQIDAIGQYQRTIKKQTMYLDRSSMGFGMSMPGDTSAPVAPVDEEPLAIQFGRWNLWTGGVTVSLPLIVPSLWKNIQMSELDLQLVVEQSNASKINLVNNLKKAYYALIFAKESQHVFMETYKNDSIVLSNIKARYNQGLAAEYDVITAEVQLQNNIPNIIQSENMVKVAELQLKMLMGIDENQPLKVLGSLKDFENNIQVPSVEVSIADNSDLKQFEIQQLKTVKSMEMLKLQRLPVLVSNFSYMVSSQNDDFKFKKYLWSPYSNVGISLSVPIFNGFQRNNNIKQMQITQNQLQLQREDTERKLKLAVTTNRDLIIKNQEQIATSRNTILLAQKGYEITQKRYETGMATIVELNSASLGLTSAKLRQQNAIYDYLTAIADLEKILGKEN